jgi:hypothetical protein
VGTHYFWDNMQVTNALRVDGATTLNSNLLVNSSAAVTGTLGITGAITTSGIFTTNKSMILASNTGGDSLWIGNGTDTSGTNFRIFSTATCSSTAEA